MVLDFFAEGDPGWLKTEGWWGTPWIWCMLHDMGQNYGMCEAPCSVKEVALLRPLLSLNFRSRMSVADGMLDTVAAAPLAAAAANHTMIGQGMVPEGFEQNPNGANTHSCLLCRGITHRPPAGFAPVYEFFSEVAFEPDRIDPAVWSEGYAARRLHDPPPAAVEAWAGLYRSGVHTANRILSVCCTLLSL